MHILSCHFGRLRERYVGSGAPAMMWAINGARQSVARDIHCAMVMPPDWKVRGETLMLYDVSRLLLRPKTSSCKFGLRVLFNLLKITGPGFQVGGGSCVGIEKNVYLNQAQGRYFNLVQLLQSFGAQMFVTLRTVHHRSSASKPRPHEELECLCVA